MRSWLLHASLLVFLVACADPSEEGRSADKPIKQASLPAPINVMGEWRVMGIDGKQVNENYAVAFSIDADGIQIRPPCVHSWAWSYEYAGGQIALDPLPPPAAIIPLPRCDETQEKLAAALDAVTNVNRTRENGVLLSGSGHSVLLFSQ